MFLSNVKNVQQFVCAAIIFKILKVSGGRRRSTSLSHIYEIKQICAVLRLCSRIFCCLCCFWFEDIIEHLNVNGSIGPITLPNSNKIGVKYCAEK